MSFCFKSFLFLVLFFSLSQCGIKKISNAKDVFKLEVKSAFIQTEYPGTEDGEERTVVYLNIEHSDNCKILSIEIQDKEVILDNPTKNKYEGRIPNFSIQKNSDRLGELAYTVSGELYKVKVYNMEQKEPVYLP